MELGDHLANGEYQGKNLSFTKKCMRTALFTGLYKLRYDYDLPQVNPFVFPMRWLYQTFGSALLVDTSGKVNFNPKYFQVFAERARAKGFNNPQMLSDLRLIFAAKFHADAIDQFVGYAPTQDKLLKINPKKHYSVTGLLDFEPSEDLIKTIYNTRKLSIINFHSYLWDFVAHEMGIKLNIKASSLPKVHGGLMKGVSWQASEFMIDDILLGKIKADGTYAPYIDQLMNMSRAGSRLTVYKKLMESYKRSQYFRHKVELDRYKDKFDLVYFSYSMMWFKESIPEGSVSAKSTGYMPGIPTTTSFFNLETFPGTNSIDFAAALSGISGYVFCEEDLKNSNWFERMFGRDARIYGCPMFDVHGNRWYGVEQVLGHTSFMGNLVWDDLNVNSWNIRRILAANFHLTKPPKINNLSRRVRSLLENKYTSSDVGEGFSSTTEFATLLRSGLTVNDFDSAVKSLVPPAGSNIVLDV